MKRLIIFLLTLIPFYINGQSIYDVYNVSTSYYQGSAKSMAMGNAMGAVGQDFSSISINPAGLGLFRKPTLTFTPSIISTHTSSELNGNIEYDTKTKVSVNNFGYVGINKTGKNIITWSFGMNRSNNFNNNIYVDGYNGENSLIDAYITEMTYNNIHNDVGLEEYSPSYIYPLWKTWLLDFSPNGDITSPVPMGGLRQLKGVNSWGGTNEWGITTSINFKDKVFLGISINMPYVYSKKITDYKEDFSTSSHTNYWLQEEVLSTTGWGFNGKFGIIAYPARWIRLGAAFHTPTIYNLTDTWKTETVAQIDENRINYIFTVPTSYFNYSMATPWRANASTALIFGNFGMITADCEYVDYSMIRLSSYEYDYQPYNENIRNTFKPTMNIRLGTEWRYQNYCFRGGYSYYGSPYGLSETDYTRNALSCGIGYTKHLFTIDLAYVYTIQNHNYNLYSQYTNYYNEVAPNLIVNEKTNLHSVVVTFKYRMY